jgi:signal peptidase I
MDPLVTAAALFVSALAAAVLPACRAGAGTFKAGDSMLPSIAVGRDLSLRALDGAPRRGDVIVFDFPGADARYFKRVIGLPGDVLAVDGETILLNGAPIPSCSVGAWSYDDKDAKAHHGVIWLEALEGRQWLVFHDADVQAVTGVGPWTVAPAEVFVLGDNRDNTTDSRKWFGGKGGGLPVREIVGVAVGVDAPTLPQGAEKLQSALERCVAALSR